MLAASTNQGAMAQDEMKQDGEKDETVDLTQTTTDTGSLTIASFKKKRVRRTKTGGADESTSYGGGNEELKALEAHILRISKQGEGS